MFGEDNLIWAQGVVVESDNEGFCVVISGAFGRVLVTSWSELRLGQWISFPVRPIGDALLVSYLLDTCFYYFS